jgi:hypothetical protein
MHVEKSTIHRVSGFQYIADAFDGKTLWLLIDEELENTTVVKNHRKGINTFKVSRKHRMEKKETMNQILTRASVLLKIIKILEI